MIAMELFVTGGTGVLGRSTIRLLVDLRHRVNVLSRSSENDEVIRALGARPIEVDLFDAASVRRGLDGCEAVLHFATRIPPANRMRFSDSWTENDRIRRDGTRILVDAALANGTMKFVYPSVCFVYADSADRWIDAETGRTQRAPAVEATLAAEAEVDRFTREGQQGFSLRMGAFYGPESSQTLEQLRLARKGLVAAFGARETYHSAIWIHDAAKAVVSALEGGLPGIYDVVDDDPLTNSDALHAIGQAVGRRKLWRLPSLALRMTVGKRLMQLLSRSQRISNQRFKDATGWFPAVPSACAGWLSVAQSCGSQ